MADSRNIAQDIAFAVAESTPPAVTESVHYPDSDGHFLPPTPLQARAVLNVRFGLEQHFHKVDKIVLEGDMFMYYEEGNPAASISPDVYVVRDHDLGNRGVYKFWEEGKSPAFALDVISPSGTFRQWDDKWELYARLRIGEYFLFQPNPSKRGQRLEAYGLRGDSYIELPATPGGAVSSPALGVSFRVEGKNLRLRSLGTGEDYRWIEEINRNRESAKARIEAAQAKLQAAKARAAAEAIARREVEKRIAELEALVRQRGY